MFARNSFLPDKQGDARKGAAGDTLNNWLTLFEQRGWLAEQPLAFRLRILEIARGIGVARGDCVLRLDGPPGGIYGVLSGGIGIEGTGPYNLPRLGHILRSGNWFGHRPILSGGGKRVQTMRAMEDSELVYVPLAPLRKLVGEDPDAARSVGHMADIGSILATRILSDLLIPSAPHRIAAVLLRVTGAEDGIEPDHPDGFLITQTDLGEMANVSRSNVNRVLSTFAARGWIAKRYQRLRVCDLSALRGFAMANL